MKLEKAIEIVTLTTSITPKVHPPDEHDAIKLLIEAGKRIIALRPVLTDPRSTHLPGETDD